LDERLQTSIGRWVNEMMEGGAFAPSDYLRSLSGVVLTLGRHGKGVIIGRGAQFILEPKRTFRVRCYAPLEQRIRYIGERDHMTYEQAKNKVLRVDGERVAFYREHFDVDVTEPSHYDMLLNTGSMPLEQCAKLVAAGFRARFDSVA
jgi:cytidylate kinase